MPDEKNVLIAEGSRDLSAAISRLLTKKGYNVDVANDGVQAVTLIKEKVYCRLIADYKLSRITTDKVVESFLSSSNAPVVIITDSRRPKVKDEWCAIENAFVLYQPFTEKALLDALQIK